MKISLDLRCSRQNR